MTYTQIYSYSFIFCFLASSAFICCLARRLDSPAILFITNLLALSFYFLASWCCSSALRFSSLNTGRLLSLFWSLSSNPRAAYENSFLNYGPLSSTTDWSLTMSSYTGSSICSTGCGSWDLHFGLCIMRAPFDGWPLPHVPHLWVSISILAWSRSALVCFKDRWFLNTWSDLKDLLQTSHL